jgi:predicted amidohydrolase YtcJ
MQLKHLLIYLLLPVLLWSCNRRQPADLIIHNASIYTVDSTFQVVEAMVVKDGRFVATGSNRDILAAWTASEVIDAQGQAIYPGLIDAHCHFLRYGLGLLEADLGGASSFDEIVGRLVAHRQDYPEAAWIKGRGWDQNRWPVKEFPTKDTIDKLFPDTPVLLVRVDGHAALVNQKALDLAGIKAGDQILGGLIETRNGQLTGILVDNAIGLVRNVEPAPSLTALTAALKNAEQNCFAVGLTTVDDAGLDKEAAFLIDSLHKSGTLDMRIYLMVNPSEENKAHYFKTGPYKTEKLNVRSFKVYADGALGSRGACLLHDYHDQPGNTGFLLKSPQDLRTLTQELFDAGFQMNTHCIGDSANRLLLTYYGEVLKGKNDRRWRIEHAQVVASEDMRMYSDFNIIPSVQPTHATSDMYWAGDRLGPRVKTAYAYLDLLKQNGTLALGSDFPVEDINPIWGFHAAVARQDGKNWPQGGFQPENAISREDAMRGMTIWAAHSNFEEGEKGSIEAGKLADFVIMQPNHDIMKIAPEQMRDAKIQATYLGGKQVYGSK